MVLHIVYILPFLQEASLNDWTPFLRFLNICHSVKFIVIIVFMSIECYLLCISVFLIIKQGMHCLVFSFCFILTHSTSHHSPNYDAQHIVIQKMFNLHTLPSQNHDLFVVLKEKLFHRLKTIVGLLYDTKSCVLFLLNKLMR